MSTVNSATSTSTNTTTSTSTSNNVNLISGLSSATTARSTTRITGMYSGLDTDTLVKDMLYSEQAKLDKIFKSETLVQWKYQAYTDIKTQLKDFRNTYMSATSSANIYSTAAYKAYAVSMTSNNYVSVTATSAASAGAHTISSVTMAQAATLSGTKYRSQAASYTSTAGTNKVATATGTKALQSDAGDVALKDLKYSDGTSVFSFADESDKLSFTVNGKSFVFDQSETLNNVITAVNDDTTAKATMSLNTDGTITIKSDVIGSSSALNLQNVAGDNSVFGTDGAFGIAEGDAAKSSAVKSSMTLEEIAAATGKDFGFDSSGNVSFTINGKTFSFDKTQTMDEVMSTVNADETANVRMTYDSASDKFMVRSNVTGTGTSLALANVGDGQFFSASSPVGIAAGSTTKKNTIDIANDSIKDAAAKMGMDLTLDADNKFTFSINGKSFSFDASTTSVSAMMQKVNADSDANATMTYSSITDSFTIVSDTMGADASLTVENGSGVNAFGSGGFFGLSDSSATGSDASMVIDGETVTQSSNTFTIDGMTFKLTANFDSTASGSTQSAIDFSVSQDIDSVIAKVKAFVTDYNALVASLNSTISEQQDYDYPILSESERSSLSEEDLATWDTKAKQGILHNDSGISDLLVAMRTALYKKVGDTGLSASDIGLSTGTWSDKGQITLDEDKLRSVLQTDPDAVSEVMVGSSTSTDAATKTKYSGLITGFYTQMTNYENTLTKTTLVNLTNKLSDDKTKYSEQLEKMQDKETEYYNRFAAMETALAQYSAQMSWLTSQFSS